tara:strand:- start:484 stop:891 length:408 start_codon:yes stop_codon:yes gene_type:complete
MKIKTKAILVSLMTLGLLSGGTAPIASKAGSDEMGAKGAKIYCFMRQTGNSHEVSWKAAYEVIKRQKSSIFKTSPKHGAVLIVESVVASPSDFEDCGSYLGDLFSPTIEAPPTNIEESEDEFKPSKTNVKDRYSF